MRLLHPFVHSWDPELVASPIFQTVSKGEFSEVGEQCALGC
jgi:hypothetical protein